ncbi:MULTISPECIES: nicotinate phosphoribosyltransferase [Myxococcus]|uniref:nicotinate phosphoribosyltransferase n=1 Tax=Myxococcus llanfairpwllgwyngyllgogerychwyrndrobwllllantysiliogogogochensis TaxID=2590453 RepID=A0A540WWI0_9BACT|nr:MULTISPECIES: nicotinate phosphoribosyltransferase [Myxococcus]NTX00804.1 nicotinate phosphoribosyltransferase [Myxococcus sp. CA040A]NTX12492.1 nicotinate phosphoribosyltransferase [Myxococcus sp. CA056]NTX33511.1 nicotinate phosphoribosyltransferase [Myxococcus sp. CA033]NTX52486.1 nicotinate phosphoribosyltransferase [Myxococcus sp. CA039A]TQF12774.1 nicotinate phosphoribosyltransferase [Myxococcus llanfairpwllgwyngyllgogerychwyrndrobwllllantysiliogogogochensis]
MATSLLATDGYKFSMAEAGWPLRRETFYYSHRKGGLQVMPLDLAAYVRSLLPEPKPEDYDFLARYDYEMGVGFKAAILRKEKLSIRAIPRGTLFFPREPILTLTGPSALVSWVEPLLLQLNFRIQVATQALMDRDVLARALARVTCEEQKTIALETLDAVGVKPVPITVDSDGYAQRVRATVQELVDVVEDPARIFEVGLRAATCLGQHDIALRACKDVGVTRTSNVEGARSLGMMPVGTMGHEHIQRYGSDDAAFRAMRERRPQRSSYLLDTFDTLTSGIPAAFQLIREDPGSGDSIRFDSGNKKLQYLYAVTRARDMGIKPVNILEDGLDAEATREFEELRRQVGWDPSAQFYGYGGHIVARTMDCPFTRDRVAAIYKLSQTGPQPVMKFGNELAEGKQSIPGTPVLFRRRHGSGPIGLVGQEGEPVPEGYFPLMEAEPEKPSLVGALEASAEPAKIAQTPATKALVEELTRRHFPKGR